MGLAVTLESLECLPKANNEKATAQLRGVIKRARYDMSPTYSPVFNTIARRELSSRPEENAVASQLLNY